MGYLLDRINERFITRQLINKVWIDLENNLKRSGILPPIPEEE